MKSHDAGGQTDRSEPAAQRESAPELRALDGLAQRRHPLQAFIDRSPRMQAQRSAIDTVFGPARTFRISGRSPIQRVPIPGTNEDTSVIAPDPSLLSPLPLQLLLQFWREVYREDAERAVDWRLAICEELLQKLADKNYGPVNRALLQGLNAQQVQAALVNKTPLSGGSNKVVASIQVGGRDLAAARLQTSKDETKLTDEASMLQLLDMLGVRVPGLYGEKTKTEPDLPRDAMDTLNMLMDRVRTTRPPLMIWDMGVGDLAPKLVEFLQQKHGHDANAFEVARLNMLRDLIRLRQVTSVLTIADLQVLIEEETGHLVTFDPGAIVPKGMAKSGEREKDTIGNIADACETIGTLRFLAPEVKKDQIKITRKDAEFLGECVDADDLLKRAEQVLGRATEGMITTLTPDLLRRLIKDNAKLADLEDLVCEALPEALELLSKKQLK
ncbi:hypothetical protein CDL60_08620 [Roseateles noduli]|nr:hypothetical protein CDL60_08620 [Roseateles noduli]